MRNQTNKRKYNTFKYYFWDSNQTPLLEADLKSAAPANYAKVAKKMSGTGFEPCYRLERAVSYTARLTGLIREAEVLPLSLFYYLLKHNYPRLVFVQTYSKNAAFLS